MKIEVTSYGKTITVETTYDDVEMSEIIEIIRGILYQMTFSEQTINEYIKNE